MCMITLIIYSHHYNKEVIAAFANTKLASNYEKILFCKVFIFYFIFYFFYFKVILKALTK